MHSIRFFNLFGFLLAHLLAPAQAYVDILRVEQTVGLGQKHDSIADARMSESVVDLTVPIVLKGKKITPLVGFLAEYTMVHLVPDAGLSAFGAAAIKLGAVVKHREKFTGTYVLLPKWSANQFQLNSRTTQLGLLALWKWTKTQQLNFRAGVYANSELFGPFVVPVLGIYAANSRWECSANLPLQADLHRKFGQHFRAGLRFLGINKSHYLSRDFAKPRYIEKANNEIGLYLGANTKTVHLQVFFGHSFLRSYYTYAHGDKMSLALMAIKIANDRTRISESITNAWVAKVGLLLRLPT